MALRVRPRRSSDRLKDRCITAVDALEILDSRGWPTIEASVTLRGGVRASSSVPSGASTGAGEAAELRDADAARYGGRGVQRAVAAVRDEIAAVLAGRDAADQASIDAALRDLDGTPGCSRLGGNAMLAVSQACARAAARWRGVPLYASLGGDAAPTLPAPMVNIVNGGRHADSSLDVEEFMVVPRNAPTFAEALRQAAETFHGLGRLLRSRGCGVAVGDEGGYAPLLRSHEEAFELIVDAIDFAGFRPGADLAIAIDVAAGTFHEGGRYRMDRTDFHRKSSAEMAELYERWAGRYPIVAIEDPFADDDWEGFRALTAAIGERVQVVGDDLLATNAERIGIAAARQACNAAVIKPNQAGTVSDAVAAVRAARAAGWPASSRTDRARPATLSSPISRSRWTRR